MGFKNKPNFQKALEGPMVYGDASAPGQPGSRRLELEKSKSLIKIRYRRPGVKNTSSTHFYKDGQVPHHLSLGGFFLASTSLLMSSSFFARFGTYFKKKKNCLT